MKASFNLVRDPLLLLNLLGSVVMVVSAFLFPLSIEQQGVINAAALAVVGLLAALRTSDGQLPALMGLFKALLALGLAFGLRLAPEQQAVLMTFLAAASALWVRPQVSPVGAPAPAVNADPVTVVNDSAAGRIA